MTRLRFVMGRPDNGKPMTNSRDVAELFSRLHKNVLQGIQNLECSPEFARLNFQPWEVPHPSVKGRTITTYNMTKDGFTFLVMGYTGSLAARFKEAYITTPIVTMKMGQAVCNSRMVAEFFGKQHAHVLRDIDKILAALGSPVLEDLFVESVNHHAKARKMVRSFNMTKDGFSLLAMGFTGPQALQFKLAFIKRFNEMEESAPDYPSP